MSILGTQYAVVDERAEAFIYMDAGYAKESSLPKYSGLHKTYAAAEKMIDRIHRGVERKIREEEADRLRVPFDYPAPRYKDFQPDVYQRIDEHIQRLKNMRGRKFQIVEIHTLISKP